MALSKYVSPIHTLWMARHRVDLAQQDISVMRMAYSGVLILFEELQAILGVHTFMTASAFLDITDLVIQRVTASFALLITSALME